MLRLSPFPFLLLLALPAGAEPPLTDRHGDPLPPAAVARMGTVRYRQAGLLAVASAPDGKTLAVGGSDECVHLIAAATGTETRVLRGPTNWVTGVVFTAGGKVIVAASADRTVRWWDAATGKELRRVKQTGDLHGLTVTPDGKTLAWSEGRVIRLVDATTGKVVRSLTGNEQTITSLAFDGRGRLLASESEPERSVRLWDPATGKELRRIEVKKRLKVKGDRDCPVALSPDGKLLATHDQISVCLIDTATGKETFRLLRHTSYVKALAFSPDGKHLAYGCDDATVRVWDLANRQQLQCLSGRQLSASALAWSPDGKLLASTSLAVHLLRSLCVWDTITGADLSPQPAHQGPIRALAVAPDGRTLATGSTDATMRLWDPLTGKQLRRLETDNRDVAAVAFSPDGKYLVAHRTNAAVAVWDAAAGKAVPLPEDFSDRVFALAPQGRLIATAPPGNGLVSLCDFPSFKLRRRLTPPAELTSVALAFSPDGTILAASDAENDPGNLVLWETGTGRRRLWLKETGGHVAFSPDGLILATWSWRGPAQLREVATGRILRLLDLPKPGDVYALAFSPDGRMVVLGGGIFTTNPGTNTIRVFETATGRERCRLLGHWAPVKALAFFPDGRRLASGSDDSTALIWDLRRAALGEPPGKPLVAAELEKAWEDLAAPDAARAYRALCRLACDPARSLPLVDKHLRLQDSGPTLEKLIATLDSNTFREREQASQQLAERGWDAEAALRQALTNKPSPEARRRINALLEKLKPNDLSGIELQWRRAVELLEQVRTPEAARVLRRIADGDPASRRVLEARAALAHQGLRMGKP